MRWSFHLLLYRGSPRAGRGEPDASGSAVTKMYIVVRVLRVCIHKHAVEKVACELHTHIDPMGTSGSQLLVSPAYKYEQWEAVAAGVAKRVTNVCMVSDIYSDKCRQRRPPTHTPPHTASLVLQSSVTPRNNTGCRAK